MSSTLSKFSSKLKNAILAKKKAFLFQKSSIIVGICNVLKSSNFIEGFDFVDVKLKAGSQASFVRVLLKYHSGSISVISDVKQISKSGCRVYSKSSDILNVREGLGIYVVSTSSGIMSSHDAIKKNIGGEVLLEIF